MDVWCSLPCTNWCSWNRLNAARLGSRFRARLAYKRRSSLRMVGNAERVVLAALGSGGRGHFEWPAYCDGWRSRRVQTMISRLKMVAVIFHGCCFGVLAGPELLALKPWKVATTSHALASGLGTRRCPRGHPHGPLSGTYATRSGHYTPAMCRFVLRHLADEPRPGRTGAVTDMRDSKVHSVGHDRHRLLRLRPSPCGCAGVPFDLLPSGPPVLRGYDELRALCSTSGPLSYGERDALPHYEGCRGFVPDRLPPSEGRADPENSTATDMEVSALQEIFGPAEGENEEEADIAPSESSTATGTGLIALQESFNAEEDAAVTYLEPSALEADIAPDANSTARPVPRRPVDPSCEAVAVLEALHQMASAADSAVAKSWRAPCATPGTDRRDLFPLPPASFSDLPAEFPEASSALLLDAVNLCIAGLNCLDRAGAVAPFAAPRARGPSSTQRTALAHISERTATMFWRFGSSQLPKSGPVALQSFEPSAAPAPPRLVAKDVDLPAAAASCDPTTLVGPELLDILRNPSTIFPDEQIDVASIRAPRADRGEYVLTIARMLRIGKMSLCFSPCGVGALFAVRKSKPGHLRPIWHGGRVSELSRRPPAPRRLGNPASFLDLSVHAGEGLVMSKRDAASFFDVLQAPPEARRWFCCPPLRLEELARALDCDIPALERFTLDVPPGPLRGRMLAFPASLTWPMGFSWSSAIAQDVTLGVLLSTGFREEAIICDSEELPADTAELAVVATDDTIFFHRNEEVAMERLAKFDRALEVSGIPRAVDKDLTCVDRLMGLGCELTALPPRAAPEASKLATLILATTNLSTVRRASPRGLHGMLGLGSWFCILSRPHYSCFNSIYGFVMRLPEDVVVDVPADVIGELALFAAFLCSRPASIANGYH